MDIKAAVKEVAWNKSSRFRGVYRKIIRLSIVDHVVFQNAALTVK